MKKTLSLDFIIIFIFGFLFLMSWDHAAIFNFIVFFGLCLGYLWLDKKIIEITTEVHTEQFWRYKTILFFSIIGFLLCVTLVPNILLRHEDPNLPIHDNVQQMEPAIEFLLHGKNPYTENYFGTELEKSAYIFTTQGKVLLNPALFHVIKLPFHILFSVPFQVVASQVFGFYDERMTYLFLFIISILVLFSLPIDKKNKFPLTAFFVLNPLFLPFFISGRDDVFVLTWIILTIWLLKKNKILLSSLTLALACSSKHSAWFLVPFYYAYVFSCLQLNASAISSKVSQKIKSIISSLWILFQKTWLLPVVFLLIIVPFIVWDPVAFYQDIYAYPAGTLITSYPINGYGVSVLFYKLGIVEEITDYVPLWVLQIPLTLILFYLLIKKQLKQNSLSRLVFGYAVLILVYWLFARFFHDNYVGFTSQLFLIAYFL